MATPTEGVWMREFLVKACQRWEGVKPDNWDQMDETDRDEYVTANWELMRDEDVPSDDNQLECWEGTP